MKQRDDTARPWSPEEVEVGMATVSEQIEAGVAAYRVLGETAAQAKHDAELEESKLLLLAAAAHPELRTDALRKAWVHQQIAELQLAAVIADHQVKSQAKVLAGLEYQADLLRSAGRSHRDMREGGGWGQGRN